jgi:hypothetical protein
MSGAIPSLPQYVFMAWCLVKHRDNFTFYLDKAASIKPGISRLLNFVPLNFEA